MMGKLKYYAMDSIMCLMMNWIQWKLRHQATTKEALEIYLKESDLLRRHQFFEAGPMEDLSFSSCDHSASSSTAPSSVQVSQHDQKNLLEQCPLQATPLCSHKTLHWKSSSPTSHPENSYAQALFFPCPQEKTPSKTVIILHALMSAGNQGYRKIAARLNSEGWNVLFPYLPFHYARTPTGYYSGALTITADLVRNGEILRQAVREVRQLVQWSRHQGTQNVAILGTSYGAWVAALLLSVEPLERAILLQPIVDINYTTFQSPIALVLGKLLQHRGISPEHLARHAHLTAPLQGQPLCAPSSISIIGASYDKVAPPKHLQQLCQSWKGSSYHEVPQGHFGFLAMERALELLLLSADSKVKCTTK